MKHEYEKARRHAENTLAEVNRHLDTGKITNPRHHHMLTDMAEKAMRTLNHIDRMDNDRRPYSETHIGYDVNRQRTNDRYNAVDDVMDAIDMILPQLDNRYDDVDDRRGVPGTGRRRVRRVRADDRYDDKQMDDYDDYMDDMDDREVVNMPRWRSARTGRFLPNLYGRGRVRRVRRRSEMDDDRYNRYDDRYDYNRYDDRHMDDMRRTTDDARRVADEARRTADDARYIPPMMDRTDRMRTDDRRYTSDDRRADRTDNRTDDRMNRTPGPQRG